MDAIKPWEADDLDGTKRRLFEADSLLVAAANDQRHLMKPG